MSWTSILTTLTLTLITAILVMIYGWNLWMAFEVVVAFSGGLILMLLAALLWLTPKPDRAKFLQVVRMTCLKELAVLWKTLRFK